MLMYSKKNQIGEQQSASGFEEHQKNILASSKYSSRDGVPQSMRERFEGRYGFDLSEVKVHSGAPERFGAIAYTQGADIYMSKSTEAIKDRILSHELMHVVQQAQGKVAPDFGILNVNPIMELSADSGAREAMSYAGDVGGTLAPLPSFSSSAPVQCAKKKIPPTQSTPPSQPTAPTNPSNNTSLPKLSFFERRRREAEEELMNDNSYKDKLKILKDVYSLEAGTMDMPATLQSGQIPDEIGNLKGSRREHAGRGFDITDEVVGITDSLVSIGGGISDITVEALGKGANEAANSASGILGGIGSAASLLGGVIGAGKSLKDIVKNSKEAGSMERAEMGLDFTSSLTSVATGVAGITSLAQGIAPEILPGLGIVSGVIDIASGTMSAVKAGKKQKKLEGLATSASVSDKYDESKGIMGQSDANDKEQARLRNIAGYAAYNAKSDKVKGITSAVSGSMTVASGALSLAGPVGPIAAAATSLAAIATKGIGGGVARFYGAKGRKGAIRAMEGTKDLKRKGLKAHERIIKKETGMGEKERYDALRIKDAFHLYNTGTAKGAGGTQVQPLSKELVSALDLNPDKSDISPKDIAEGLGLSSARWRKMFKKHNKGLPSLYVLPPASPVANIP